MAVRECEQSKACKQFAFANKIALTYVFAYANSTHIKIIRNREQEKNELHYS